LELPCIRYIFPNDFSNHSRAHFYSSRNIISKISICCSSLSDGVTAFKENITEVYNATLRFVNVRYGNTVIRKISGDDGRPLAGVIFEITAISGERIRNPLNGSFEFVTDSAGQINLSHLPAGTYTATETQPLAGYKNAEPQTFQVINDENVTITFRNYKNPSVVIRKIDGDTDEPLEGVVFEIVRYLQNGRTGERLKNYAVDNSYEFITDSAGQIYLPALENGTWQAIETRPLDGYMAAEPTTFRTGQNGDHTVIIRNYRYPSLTIQKVNSITRAPLEGVHFEISRHDGTRVTNPDTGFFTFITDRSGLIHLPVLEDGNYILTETRALSGFLVDEEIIHFTIDSSSRQREHVLVVENTPASGLVIIKTDAQSGLPLEGVEFEIRTPQGTLITGQMLDGNQLNTPHNSPQLASNGLFLTDHRGRIELNHLQPSVYHIRETNALPGYELDDTVHVVTVHPGEQTVLEVANRTLGGIRLVKVDAWTGDGIYNVEFMVFDANGSVVGVFYTDDQGQLEDCRK
jgi:uncharacterized surface anchored protein